jgi:hypothetical protein
MSRLEYHQSVTIGIDALRDADRAVLNLGLLLYFYTVIIKVQYCDIKLRTASSQPAQDANHRFRHERVAVLKRPLP